METVTAFFTRTRRNALGYILAFLVAAASLAAGAILFPFVGSYAPYITLFPAVALAASYLGAGPAVMTIVLVLLGGRHWFAPGAQTSYALDMWQPVAILALLFCTGVIVVIGELGRRKLESVCKAQGELEDRVKQRTADLNGANASLRELTARLLHLQDEERRRIARELHDSAGQTLTALAMNLSAVKNDIERLQKTAQTISDSTFLVQEMSDGIRTMSYLLHPPLLDEVGLPAALRWYIEGFAKRSNIKVNLEFPEDFGRLPQDLETAIFRVLQECLTNIHRHSQSPTATIRISRSSDEVRVEIEDCGKGISSEKRGEIATSGTIGVGIRGMRERIGQLNGTLEVNSGGSGQGTRVVVWLPMGETPATSANAKMAGARD